jgi:hypothetical protein
MQNETSSLIKLIAKSSFIASLVCALLEFIAVLCFKLNVVAVTTVAAAFWLLFQMFTLFAELGRRITKMEVKLTEYGKTTDQIVQEMAKSCMIMDHIEIASELAKYIPTHVTTIKAFTRSTVTGWKTFGAATDEYLHAHKGKTVTRIFVLTDEGEFKEYSERVFPKHVEVYGGENIFVISQRKANTVIETLPTRGKIGTDEDFAIVDDELVAFCKGRFAQIRIDNLEICRKIFNTVKTYCRSYNYLKANPQEIKDIFRNIV